MTFNFDEVIERRNTGCAKWDRMPTQFGLSTKDALPMWVADMEFRPPPSVQDVFDRMATHGLYGYAHDPGGFELAAANWLERRHNCKVDQDSLIACHGVLSAISVAIQAYSKVDDTVIIFTPVYHVFHKLIEVNQRRLLQSPLVPMNGRYHMDLEGLSNSLTGRERIVLLSSPHNPGGTVWTKNELKDLANFCAQNDLILLCDEIHHDLVYNGNQHHVVCEVAPEHIQRIVVFLAPTKTFNIASAMTGLVVIANEQMREQFLKIHNWISTAENGIGRAMSKAAYSEGDAWLDSLLKYLESNREIFERGVNEISGLQTMPLCSTAP